MGLKLLFVTLSTASIMLSSAYGCMGAYIQLNDDTALTGSGIYDISDKKEKNFVSLAKDIGHVFEVTDSSNKVTHLVVVLGGHRDDKDIDPSTNKPRPGVISVSYLVKDIETLKETVYILKSNYVGDGVRTRSISKPTSNAVQSKEISALKVAGC